MRLKKTGRRKLAVLTSALAVLLIPFSAGSASANTSPGWGDDRPDVVWDCNHGKAKCWYHEVNAWTALGKRREVGNPIYNCSGSQTVDQTLTWRTDRTTSYSFEQSTSVEVSAGLAKEIEAGMTASSTQTETWQVGTTLSASQSLTSHVPPGEAGGWWFAPYWRHSQGWIEAHYGKRNHGHYYWYYPGRGSTGVQTTTPVRLSDGQMKGKWYWATWKC
ncbi:hypothetical protein ACFZDK_42825 [Streptomyces sp. NPDC007901]|uniref:hypothetical protein n=1 Tax=Streptomyces sp. NPDC007901 TaxID=3364785 RepID=UPI0036E58403